jgi:hypothetical protein
MNYRVTSRIVPDTLPFMTKQNQVTDDEKTTQIKSSLRPIQHEMPYPLKVALAPRRTVLMNSFLKKATLLLTLHETRPVIII